MTGCLDLLQKLPALVQVRMCNTTWATSRSIDSFRRDLYRVHIQLKRDVVSRPSLYFSVRRWRDRSACHSRSMEPSSAL